MPSHLVQRINLDLLYPPFLAKFLDLLAACETRGAHFYAQYGYRSFAEQAKIYFQGRTTPGPRVTNAGPGFSTHNYGLAVDVVRDLDLVKVGLQPDWKAEGYKVLAEEGAKLGLQVGVPGLSDLGHVQVPLSHADRKEKDVLEALKKVHDAAPRGQELAEVWAALEKMGV